VALMLTEWALSLWTQYLHVQRVTRWCLWCSSCSYGTCAAAVGSQCGLRPIFGMGRPSPPCRHIHCLCNLRCPRTCPRGSLREPGFVVVGCLEAWCPTNDQGLMPDGIIGRKSMLSRRRSTRLPGFEGLFALAGATSSDLPRVPPVRVFSLATT